VKVMHKPRRAMGPLTPRFKAVWQSLFRPPHVRVVLVLSRWGSFPPNRPARSILSRGVLLFSTVQGLILFSVRSLCSSCGNGLLFSRSNGQLFSRSNGQLFSRSNGQLFSRSNGQLFFSIVNTCMMIAPQCKDLGIFLVRPSQYFCFSLTPTGSPYSNCLCLVFKNLLFLLVPHRVSVSVTLVWPIVVLPSPMTCSSLTYPIPPFAPSRKVLYFLHHMESYWTIACILGQTLFSKIRSHMRTKGNSGKFFLREKNRKSREGISFEL
jgi:hypothetical protein